MSLSQQLFLTGHVFDENLAEILYAMYTKCRVMTQKMLSRELLSDIAEQIKDEMFEQVFGPVLEFKVTPFGAQKVMRIFYPDADSDMLDKFKS